MTTFVDLPQDRVAEGAVLTLRNQGAEVLNLESVSLHLDLEGEVRRKGMWQPLRLGPTFHWPITPAQLQALRETVPSNDDFAPLAGLPVFAIAHWPPELIHERLQQAFTVAEQENVPLELQLNTWWAGTPSGSDGVGGRWYDPAYQQVTYRTETGEFGLSVPNRWSCVPWLTVASPRLNQFKQRQFQTVGRQLRELLDRNPALPLLSLVLDNEVAYWAAGMPDMPADLQADFNPGMVADAEAEGLVLDPRDGLDTREMEFLRGRLRRYNRDMASALLDGLGQNPARWQVFTHTYMGGWGFDSEAQATEVGVLEGVRMGGEWGGHAPGDNADLLDWHRELGVPANINCELGGSATAAAPVWSAYAAGCSHITLFNLSQEALERTVEDLGQSPPADLGQGRCRRPSLLFEDFQDQESWRTLLTDDEVELERIWPTTDWALVGRQVGVPNRTRMCLEAEQTLGRPRFERLAVRLRGRAFVHQQPVSEAYLAVHAGTTPDDLQEITRFSDSSGQWDIVLTEVAQGQERVWVELELFPLGLAGWVCVFDLTVEEPWPHENLRTGVLPAPSVQTLRARSLLVGWRSDAAFLLQDCERQGLDDESEVLTARRAWADGRYRDAVVHARAALLRAQPDTHRPWAPPSPDRVEHGELRNRGDAVLWIDPYDLGVMGRRIALAPSCTFHLETNGDRIEFGNTAPLLPGDDVQVWIEDGVGARIVARRGTATAEVLAFAPCTAFQLPVLGLAGLDPMPVSSTTAIQGTAEETRPVSCPLQVGDRPVTPGDTVEGRWNPETGRFVAVRVITSHANPKGDGEEP
jgi:hypothetical protein